MRIKTASLQSLITFRNSQGEKARGTLLRVEGVTVVFEVYNPYSIVQLSEVLEDLVIRAGDQTIYNGRATVNNLVNTGLLLIVSAALKDPWVENFSNLVDDQGFHQEAAEFVSRWTDSNSLVEDYRIAVGDLRSFLVELNQWLEQLRVNGEPSNLSAFESCDRLLEFASPLYQRLEKLHRQFEGAAALVPQDVLGPHKRFFQREIHPLVMRAPFLHRTYTKPLGYAGDYEMMNMIHRLDPQGPNAYAKIINTAYVRLPIALCVINRVATLERHIQSAVEGASGERPVRILSVGCGPAIEVERFVRHYPQAEAAHFSLLDFNRETLAYAESKVQAASTETGKRVRVDILHRSVHSLLKGSASPLSAEFSDRLDFVYCAGLFDYLSDKVCARLVKLFFDWVVPGGSVLVTNMHIARSNRFVLEHLADWYLIYRDEDQMRRLVPGLGEQRVFTDETGINVCLEVRKVGRAPGR